MYIKIKSCTVLRARLKPLSVWQGTQCPFNTFFLGREISIQQPIEQLIHGPSNTHRHGVIWFICVVWCLAVRAITRTHTHTHTHARARTHTRTYIHCMRVVWVYLTIHWIRISMAWLLIERDIYNLTIDCREISMIWLLIVERYLWPDYWL